MRLLVDLVMEVVVKFFIKVTFLYVCKAVMFLEHWKRRQISLSFSWDLTGIEEDEVYTVYMYTQTHTQTNEYFMYTAEMKRGSLNTQK